MGGGFYIYITSYIHFLAVGYCWAFDDDDDDGDDDHDDDEECTARKVTISGFGFWLRFRLLRFAASAGLPSTTSLMCISALWIMV